MVESTPLEKVQKECRWGDNRMGEACAIWGTLDRLKGSRVLEVVEIMSVLHLFCCDLVERTPDLESSKCKKVLLLIIPLSLIFLDSKEN